MTPEFETKRLALRLPSVDDAGALLDFHERNRERFEPFDPPIPHGFFTPLFWENYTKTALIELMSDKSARFVMAEKSAPERVIGTFGFSQIIRGPLHQCFLGFKIDAEKEGQGLMSEALQRGIKYLFENRNIHRISANHIVGNQRSAKTLERLGFENEGLAKDYLFIGGQWRDHVLTSLINHDWTEKQ